MKLYVLKKNIDHPRYTCVLEEGKLIPEGRLKFYGIERDHPRFDEFFSISKTHELKDCRIVPIKQP